MITVRRTDGDPIDVTRCEAKADRVMAERRILDHMVMMARCDAPGFASLGRWCVAVVPGGCEIAARDALARKKIAAWLPLETKRMRSRRGLAKVKSVERAVWRGYLFVRLLPCAEAWAGAMLTAGLSGWIGLDGEPALLPDRMVADLQACEKTGDFAKAARELGVPKPGDQVRIKGYELAWIVDRYHEARDEVRLVADAWSGRLVATVGLDELEI